MALKRRTPQAKKQLRYAKDHVALAEYPHGFRKLWPKKKAHSNQAYRHKVRQELLTVRNLADTLVAQSKVQAIRREKIKKWAVVSLRERVKHKLEVRRSRLGWDFFDRPYSSRRDREPFIAFLEALTAGQSPESAELARVVAAWLSPTNSGPHQLKLPEKRQWLRAFFKDEPEWEDRLRNWIISLLGTSAEL